MVGKFLVVIFVLLMPVLAIGADTKKAAPTITSDLSTVRSNAGAVDPMFLSTIGIQGSDGIIKPLIACDRHFSADLEKGGKGIGSGVDVTNVCSFSISNGPNPQIVQFVAGLSASGGTGEHCSNPDVKATVSSKMYLAPYQFISQGAGIGVLFKNPGGICIKLLNVGSVGVNVTYASTPF